MGRLYFFPFGCKRDESIITFSLVDNKLQLAPNLERKLIHSHICEKQGLDGFRHSWIQVFTSFSQNTSLCFLTPHSLCWLHSQEEAKMALNVSRITFKQLGTLVQMLQHIPGVHPEPPL